jgi:hypothetical protein
LPSLPIHPLGLDELVRRLQDALDPIIGRGAFLGGFGLFLGFEKHVFVS